MHSASATRRSLLATNNLLSIDAGCRGSPQAKFGAHRDHEPGAFASAVAPTFLSAGREAFQPPIVPRGKNASVLAGWKAGVTCSWKDNKQGSIGKKKCPFFALAAILSIDDAE